ncbi:ADP-ribosylglycohydrolase family protein [Photobacterium damselae]|uniref:ADP-ribosylglycohydrolase family protein n=1 Tax=Photobacterium damselae TaxID=38293 RepID=UPI0010FD9AD5|nr:ADP-ribosylglycohydrolase family protein [Photobacterium damselae]TLS71289.1 hypothetical protein FD718_04450 [Photobacterium damselae subsp. damselae]
MNNSRRQAIINSAIWSAYGDALGFMTELAKSSSSVHSRTGKEFIDTTLPWKRKLDGIYGTQVELPAGTYSDDTQLRLCTSRSINGRGYFDVEAFAKCELPVWLSYALGAGRGTKVATNNLIKKSVSWFSNFYKQSSLTYVQGGGNGAAMRIQPHVWAATDLTNLETYIIDVIKNAIVTHGHPRGIAGAMMHALSLARLLRTESISLETLKDDAAICSRASYFIRLDDMLDSFWVYQWEAETGESLDSAFADVAEELIRDLDLASSWLYSDCSSYADLIDILGLSDSSQRGSGTKTALTASLLLIKHHQVKTSGNFMCDIVNELQTDTDTIATMYGALFGVIATERPNIYLQDVNYIISEAQRMFDISEGKQEHSFEYPDAMNWAPNRSSLDNSSVVDGKLKIELFGELQPISPIFNDKKKEHLYRWYQTTQGFSILLKRRIFELFNEVVPKQIFSNSSLVPQVEQYIDSKNQINPVLTQKSDDQEVVHDMKVLVVKAIESNFDDAIIGQHIKLLANKKNYSIESVIAYSSIIAKAYCGTTQGS